MKFPLVVPSGIPAGNEDQGLEPQTPKDDDPDGLKLLASSDPLEQAHKLLKPLIALGAERADVWLAVYDVEIRRSKPTLGLLYRQLLQCTYTSFPTEKLLQAASALLYAQQLEPESPELHLRLVDLKIRVSRLPQEPPAPIGPAFSDAILKLEPGKLEPATYNSRYLQKHASSPQAVLACAKALQLLQPPLDEVENAIFSLLQDPVALDVQVRL